jgi:hypothetical protein
MELAAERRLAQPRGLDQAGEIDAGADAERLEQIDQILGADVAGIAAAVLHLCRMPADAAERAIEIAHARLVGRQRIDQAGAAGVVQMRDQSDVRRLEAQAGDQVFHGGGRCHAGGVAERDVIDACIVEAQRIGHDQAGIDGALERTAARHRDRPDQPEAALRRGRHLFHVLPLLGARAAQVLLRMCLAGGNEQADLGDAEAGLEIGERALDRAHVGAGRLVVHARAARQRLQQLAGIGELRHHLGIGVRRGLDAQEADRREALDQRALGGRRHELGLML